MRSIVFLAIVILESVGYSKALQCYSHETCSTNCPQLSNAIKTCTADDNKCYKAAFPGGVARGCARERCSVQVNANAVMAHICCETDLCNSAITSKTPVDKLFMAAIVLLLVHI